MLVSTTEVEFYEQGRLMRDGGHYAAWRKPVRHLLDWWVTRAGMYGPRPAPLPGCQWAVTEENMRAYERQYAEDMVTAIMRLEQDGAA